jgi:hypothetical protein
MIQITLIANMGCYSSTHLTRISTPRFLGKKRGKVTTVFNGLHKLTMIFFLEEVDPHHHETSVPSFTVLTLCTKGKRELLWNNGSLRRSSISWSTHGMSVCKHLLS